MKVLILTPDYPPTPGGIQLLMGRLAASLPDAEVGVGTIGGPGDPAADGNEVLFRVGGGRGHRLRMLILNLRGFLTALRTRPDAIIVGHVTAAPAAALARVLLRTPFVQYVHADEFRTRASLSGWSVRRADAVVAVSRYAASLAVAAGARPERASIILPGVDRPRPASASGRSDRRTILTVARMVAPYKGHDRILAALPSVRERIPDVHWVVIGDGPRRVLIEAEAERAGLGASVSLLGAADDETRDRWLRKADVLAMPSRLPPEGVGGEGFGIVYLEAAAHGLPVVAGNVAGATDAVVDGETGLLVDPEDPESIAAALVELLGDRDRAASLGAAGARRAAELSWDRHGREVRGVLDRIAGAGPATGPTRVLYVSEPEAMSGAEFSLMELLRHLPHSIEPLVATPSDPMIELLSHAGVETVRIGAVDFSFRLDPAHTAAGAAWITRTAVQLRRLARNRGIDLIHANNTKSDLPAVLVGLGPGAPPVVAHVRDEMPQNRAGRSVLRTIGALSDAVIVNSGFIGEQFRGLSDRVCVAHNSVDAGRFDPDRVDRRKVRDELGLGDAPVIAVVGHFVPPKGQDDAVRMLAELKPVVPEARLLFAGSAKFDEPGTRFDSRGFMRGVEDLARESGLADDVIFAGERDDVPEVLAAADVLLLPSWQEPFGRVLIEAMAMRVPVVATALGGPSEVISDGAEGFLRPSRDPASWAEAIAEILTDEDLAGRLGEQGRRTAIERFGADRTVAAVLATYDDVLSGVRA